MIEIERFRRARYIDRAAEFFLTPTEIAMVPADEKKHQYLASRFALKEAVFKALPEEVSYYDFEIIKTAGKPCIRFLNFHFQKYRVAVSISHTFTHAIGFAVVELIGCAQ